MRLVKPWPDGKRVNPNGRYGMRKHPKTGRWQKHRGVDVAGVYPVLSAGPGVVHKIGWSPTGGGHTVIIKHATDLFTVYYHGAHATKLRVGERVDTGTFIYTSGTTGMSTGNHLHWEVRTGRLGQWGSDVDPMPYLDGPLSATQPKLVNVNGKLDAQTWRALQTALQASGHYKGVVDGKPGEMTHKALQSWAGVKADGIIGPATRRAVQKKLGVKVDGVWGRLTISALQRALNEGRV